MRGEEEYVFSWPGLIQGNLGGAVSVIEKDVWRALYERAWRTDFGAPGFALILLDVVVSSMLLRLQMTVFKERFSRELAMRTGKRFVYRSAARFDQQVTTKFHLDGAPDESLLVLGYEPSRVRSRLAIADYSRCAFDLGITPRRFLTELNPMFAPGAARLAPYVTELRAFDPTRPQILLVNNSSLPFTPERTNPLGVMHQAEILEPSPTERRVVNSIMLAASATDSDAVGPEAIRDFVNTEHVSQRYGADL